MSGEVREQPDPVVQADLATWLNACVDDDQRVAEAALPDAKIFEPAEGYEPPADVHIERWNPRRVLAECETRRRTIELHSDTKTLAFEVDGEDVSTVACSKCFEAAPCQTLRLQTLPFVDRDGYRADLWAPDGEVDR